MNIILRNNGGGNSLVPFYRGYGLFDEIDKLARELWNTWEPLTAEQSLAPQSDIYEDKGQLVIKTELPGIDKEDLDISLEGDRLTINAEKKEEVKEEATRHVRERYYGRYYRALTLPYPVREDKVTATLENGVLELKLPRAEEAKARKIEIKPRLSGGTTGKRQRKPAQKKK